MGWLLWAHGPVFVWCKHLENYNLFIQKQYCMRFWESMAAYVWATIALKDHLCVYGFRASSQKSLMYRGGTGRFV